MEKESVIKMWKDYLFSLGEDEKQTEKTYSAWYFCDNEQDADELAQLVLEGTKKATASLFDIYEFEKDQPFPQKGDHNIITNWQGEAVCIIKTTNVEVVPFKDVTEEFARTEGEGDKSLEYWKNAHWHYFSRETKKIGKEPDENMLVVCEKFEVVYK
jgi:uncharacterized protein YhfF